MKLRVSRMSADFVGCMYMETELKVLFVTTNALSNEAANKIPLEGRRQVFKIPRGSAVFRTAQERFTGGGESRREKSSALLSAKGGRFG